MTSTEAVYRGDGSDSQRTLLNDLNSLTKRHRLNCPEYARICDCFFPETIEASSLDEIPFVPVGLFKSLFLASVPEESIYQVFRSSGTMGTPSRIVLDRKTATAQTEWLTRTMKSWLGQKRRRMLIVDSPSILKRSTARSARAAAILGMMKFGKDFLWLLDDAGEVNSEALAEWLKGNEGEPLFIFGFTFMIWKHLVQGSEIHSTDLSNAILFHGGGWKSLLAEAVSPQQFRQTLFSQFCIVNVHDYYGMVEQLGSIWVEVGEGVLVPTCRSAVLIRDPQTL